MALINFKDINFNNSTNVENKIINFNDNQIEVLNYLSINDKYDLIMTTLQRSDEIDLFNSFKTKFYFDLHLVLMYSNIVVTEEEKQDEVKLYDTLKKSGLMDMIIEQIPEKDKEELWNNVLDAQKGMMEYRKSFGAIVSTMFTKAPETIDKIKQFLADMDLNEEKMKKLLNIVTSMTAEK